MLLTAAMIIGTGLFAALGATVENSGRVPHPYLVQKILDPNNGLIRNTKPSLSGAVYSDATAAALP